MTVTRTEPHRPRPFDPGTDSVAEKPSGIASNKGAPAPASAPSPGKARLLQTVDKQKQASLSTFAKAEAGRSRVDAARSAVGELAQAVGENPAAFAARYASSSKTPAEIQKEARFAFVQETLTRRPECADALVAVRLRGLDGSTRELVTTAVQKSGAHGLARYAAAERALAKLAGLDKSARGDVLAFMKAGDSFDAAIDSTKKALAKTAADDAKARAPVDTSGLTRQALANAKAQADAVRKVTAQTHRTLHAIGKLDRVAEFSAGLGAGAGTVGAGIFAAGEAAVRRSAQPLKRALHEADAAGALLAGELTSKIRAADQTAVKLLRSAEKYETVYSRRASAIRAGDHATAAETAKQLDTLAAEVKMHGSSLAEQAKAIGKLNKDFDGAALHMAMTAAMMPLMYHAFSAPPVHHLVGAAGKAVAARVVPAGAGVGAGKAVEAVVHGGVHAGVDGTIMRGVGAVSH
ncbi:MAG: hypothetical protein L6Q84_01070 [Polyangiaceae bacterium]|nr:hypothetical protein [Polyangiaceae bacterium]